VVGRGVFLIICCGILACSCGKQPAGAEDADSRARRAGALFPVHHNGKYGYIDSTGRLVIPPRFEYADRFSEGLARVTLEGKSAYIDTTGRMVIGGIEGLRGRFSEGLARIEVKTDGGRKHGYIDRTGKVVIEPRFDAARDFSEGLAAVKVGEKWGGYIDRTGRLVIEPRFDIASLSLARFSEGLACVKVGEKRGYIDRSGKMMIEARFDGCRLFWGGLAPARVSSRGYGYIDKTGDFVIEPRFRQAGRFREGLAVCRADRGKAGHIDKTGEFVIEPRFVSAGSFSEGLAAAQGEDMLYGYIDQRGEFVIRPQFDHAGAFYGGLAHVTFGGKGHPHTGRCYVDRTGEFIWPITHPRRRGRLLAGDKRKAVWSTDWWLRFRVLDPQSKPLPGVQVWAENYRGACQVMVQSLPIAWWDIGARGTGAARAKWINYTEPSGLISGEDGVVKMGPFRGPTGFNIWGGGCALYHPRYAALQVRADPSKHAPKEGIVDLGDLRFRTGNTVAGVVTGPDGKPAENAWVAAQPFQEASTGGRKMRTGRRQAPRAGLAVGVIRTARTDAEGRYTLRGLVPARYVVAAWNETHPPSTQVVDLFGGPGREAEEQSRRAALRLQEGETITVLAREGERPGKAVPSAKVQVILSRGARCIGLGNWGGLTVFEGKTGEDGRLVVGALPKGTEYTVWVDGPRGGRWCSDRTEPGESEVARFRYGSVSVKLESNGGEAVRSFRYGLECKDSGMDGPSSWARGIHTRDRGGVVEGSVLTIPALVCGTWKMSVMAREHFDGNLTSEVTPGGYKAALRLKPGKGILKGRLVGAGTGKPVPGVAVRATNHPWYDEHPCLRFESVTDDSGSFTIGGLKGAGSHVELRIEHPGHIPAKREWREDKDVHDLGEIALARACTVHGVLTETGRPAPNRFVQLWSTDSVIKYHGHVETDPEGRWRREKLEPGRYLVVYCGARKSVEVRPGPPADAGMLETNDIWKPAGR